jgi:hypothetical protein
MKTLPHSSGRGFSPPIPSPARCHTFIRYVFAMAQRTVKGWPHLLAIKLQARYQTKMAGQRHWKVNQINYVLVNACNISVLLYQLQYIYSSLCSIYIVVATVQS